MSEQEALVSKKGRKGQAKKSPKKPKERKSRSKKNQVQMKDEDQKLNEIAEEAAEKKND